VISPLRKDVVVTGFALAIPVFLLGLRGDFTAEEVVTRLLWCLAAGWAAVALIRFASMPPTRKRHPRQASTRVTDGPGPDSDSEPTVTA
jgi:hypothetical protein